MSKLTNYFCRWVNICHLFLNLAYLWRWVLQSWRWRRPWGTGWCSGRGPAPHVAPPPGKLPSAVYGSTETARERPAPCRFSADSQTKTTKREISHEHNSPITHVYLKPSQGIRQAVKQTGRERRAWISYMAWQDNKYVINVTGIKKNKKTAFSLARLVTRASWVVVFSTGAGADISSRAMLMCQRSRHTGNRLKQWNRKSGANTRRELFQVRATIYAALSRNKLIIM